MKGYLPMSADRKVEVVEVGIRDGLQIEEAVIPVATKIDLVNRMIDAGLRAIEVTAFVSPKAVPQMADAEALLEGIRAHPDVELMALVPNRKAAERAASTRVSSGVLLCSASNTHNLKNLNRETSASLAAMPDVASVLRAGGKNVHGGIATSFGCPFEGDVPVTRLVEIARAYADLGVRHITLGDTTGMATPPLVHDVVAAIRRELPSIELTLHFHNTRGLGLANVMAGLDAGVRRFDASVGGLGGCPFAPGATGNICTEDLLLLLQECGWDTGVDLPGSIEVAIRMEQILGRRLSGQVMRSGPRLQHHRADEVATAEG